MILTKKKLYNKPLILILFFLNFLQISAMQQPASLDYSITIINETDANIALTIEYGEGASLKNLTEPTILAPKGISSSVLYSSMSWPLTFHLKSSQGIPFLIMNSVTGKKDKSLVITKNEADKSWIAGHATTGPFKGRPNISLFLRKSEDPDTITAITFFENEKFTIQRKEKKRKKREFDEKPLPVPDLRQELDIEPNSIQSTIFDLGIKKDFAGIQATVQNTANLDDLKKVFLLQINLALFIVNRIDMSSKQSDLKGYAFTQYPLQKILPISTLSASQGAQAQWSHILLQQRDNIFYAQSIAELKKPLFVMRALLRDLGYISLLGEDIKSSIIDNFQPLFEHLDVVKSVKQSPILEKMKRRMGW